MHILGHFLAILWPFLGHIVELKGKKGLFVIEQSRGTLSVATVSFGWSILTGLLGTFGLKQSFLGH